MSALSNTDLTADQLIRIADAWMERVWRQRDIAAINELHAPDFVDRSSAGRATDNAAYAASIAELYTAFPDWSAQTEDVVPDVATGKVAIRWTATGTHLAPFFNIPATGKRITFSGIEIIRVAQQRIVERWGEWNGSELLAQLGAWTPPA